MTTTTGSDAQLSEVELVCVPVLHTELSAAPFAYRWELVVLERSVAADGPLWVFSDGTYPAEGHYIADGTGVQIGDDACERWDEHSAVRARSVTHIGVVRTDLLRAGVAAEEIVDVSDSVGQSAFDITRTLLARDDTSAFTDGPITVVESVTVATPDDLAVAVVAVIAAVAAGPGWALCDPLRNASVEWARTPYVRIAHDDPIAGVDRSSAAWLDHPSHRLLR